MGLREGLSQYPYLSMLTKIWTGNWKNNLEMTNMRLDDNNGRDVGMVKGRSRKVQQFQAMNLEEHWLSRFVSYL